MRPPTVATELLRSFQPRLSENGITVQSEHVPGSPFRVRRSNGHDVSPHQSDRECGAPCPEHLAERRDTVVHRDELIRAVWGYLDTDVITRTVDFAIARLRRKIEVDHHHPVFILTAHGDGYCLSGVSDEE